MGKDCVSSGIRLGFNMSVNSVCIRSGILHSRISGSSGYPLSV